MDMQKGFFFYAKGIKIAKLKIAVMDSSMEPKLLLNQFLLRLITC
ncbi:hypothetical protein [Oceanobacillus sp. MO10714A]